MNAVRLAIECNSREKCMSNPLTEGSFGFREFKACKDLEDRDFVNTTSIHAHPRILRSK